MLEIESNIIQQYRCKKMNLSYNQIQIDNIEKLNILLNTYIGLHSARVGKVYISLLSKGLHMPINDTFAFFNSREVVKLRCFRTTLHKCTKDLSKIIHRSTLKRKTTSDFREISNRVYIQKTLDVIFKEHNSYTQCELEDKLIHYLHLSREQTKKLIFNFWNSGVLTVVNVSNVITKEKRKFMLFKEYYGFDINDYNETEQNCIDEIVSKYISTFGPVTINDIAWWSGFSLSEIHKTLKKKEKNIIELKTKGIKNILFLSKYEKDNLISNIKDNELQSWARFLSFEDSSIKAYYETRSLFNTFHKNYFNKIGEVYSTVICDGLIVGNWSYKNQQIKLQLNNITEEKKEIINIEKKRMEGKLSEINNLIIKH